MQGLQSGDQYEPTREVLVRVWAHGRNEYFGTNPSTDSRILVHNFLTVCNFLSFSLDSAP